MMYVMDKYVHTNTYTQTHTHTHTHIEFITCVTHTSCAHYTDDVIACTITTSLGKVPLVYSQEWL